MNALKKWVIVHNKPNPHHGVLLKTFVQIILAAKWLGAAFKYVPQTTATTFAFPSVLIFLPFLSFFVTNVLHTEKGIIGGYLGQTVGSKPGAHIYIHRIHKTTISSFLSHKQILYTLY